MHSECARSGGGAGDDEHDVTQAAGEYESRMRRLQAQMKSNYAQHIVQQRKTTREMQAEQALAVAVCQRRSRASADMHMGSGGGDAATPRSSPSVSGLSPAEHEPLRRPSIAAAAPGNHTATSATSYGSIADQMRKVSRTAIRKISGAVSPQLLMLRGFAQLMHADDVAIYIDDECDIGRAVLSSALSRNDFEPIRFWVHNVATADGGGQQMLYRMDVNPDEIAIADMTQHGTATLMTIALSGGNEMAKIKNSTGFKLFSAQLPAHRTGPNASDEEPSVNLVRCSDSGLAALPFMKVNESVSCWRRVLSLFGKRVCFDARTHSLYQGPVLVATCEPQVASCFRANSNAFTVHYGRGAGDEESRAVALAYAALLTVCVAYPDLAAIMRQRHAAMHTCDTVVEE